jgi:hypothetical protein
MVSQMDKSAYVCGKNSTINLKSAYAPIPIIAGESKALMGVGADP